MTVVEGQVANATCLVGSESSLLRPCPPLGLGVGSLLAEGVSAVEASGVHMQSWPGWMEAWEALDSRLCDSPPPAPRHSSPSAAGRTGTGLVGRARGGGGQWCPRLGHSCISAGKDEGILAGLAAL